MDTLDRLKKEKWMSIPSRKGVGIICKLLKTALTVKMLHINRLNKGKMKRRVKIKVEVAKRSSLHLILNHKNTY